MRKKYLCIGGALDGERVEIPVPFKCGDTVRLPLPARPSDLLLLSSPDEESMPASGAASYRMDAICGWDRTVYRFLVDVDLPHGAEIAALLMWYRRG